VFVFTWLLFSAALGWSQDAPNNDAPSEKPKSEIERPRIPAFSRLSKPVISIGKTKLDIGALW
jgi:hypothetical protein